MRVAGALSLLIPALAAGLAAKRIVGPDRGAVRIVAWFIVSASLIILPIQLVRAAAFQSRDIITRIPLGLPAAIGVSILVALVARGRGSHAVQRPPTAARRDDAEGYFGGAIYAAVIVGCAYVVVALDQLSSFPSSWDGVAYHLPLAVKWLQEGSLGILANSDWSESLPAYPEIIAMLTLATGWQELAELWNIAPASGSAPDRIWWRVSWGSMTRARSRVQC